MTTWISPYYPSKSKSSHESFSQNISKSHALFPISIFSRTLFRNQKTPQIFKFTRSLFSLTKYLFKPFTASFFFRLQPKPSTTNIIPFCLLFSINHFSPFFISPNNAFFSRRTTSRPKP
jgi:hypothetical protein